ncbi:MAG: response regulator [Alphaproteobacteria bacterium]|nr:response regulator [Alphaproteobacteria bacterium]
MPNQLPDIFSIISISLIIPFLYLFAKCRSRRAVLSVFDAVLNASDYGQIAFDAKGNLVYMNDLVTSKFHTFIACKDSKATLSEFLDYLYDNAVDYDDSVKNTIISHFDFGDKPPEFCEVIHYDEKFLCLVSARKLDNGMTLSTMIDISVVQRREKQLQHLDKLSYQLMQAVQAISTGIVVSDPKQEGNPILFANDAFYAFINCDFDVLDEEGWGVLAPLFSDTHEREKYISAILKCSEIELELDDVKDTKTETKRHYTLALSPAYHDGELDLYIGLLSDVTLHKQREAEFFKAQKLESLGGLAAGVAHDFNNALSIISGYCTMMDRTLPKKNKVERGYLTKIDVAAKRGADLTRKMLTFSSHRVVEKSTLDMRDLVTEQVEFLEPLVGAAIKVKVSFPSEEREKGVYVRGSTSSVEQVLMNFVVNARDAMPDGGELGIVLSCMDKEDVPQHVREGMEETQDFVCLSVIDNGTGMDNEILERIFDPFFTTKEQGKGTGLGMSVVYGLAKELGGQLDVISKLGHGTTMSIYIPRSDGEGARIFSGDTDLPETVRLDGYTALVAEDEPDLLEVVVCMLEDLGMHVLSASNGADALVCQEDFEEKIDVLLTDVLMPEVNGVKLAELVTALRPDTKVIFMSGFPASGNMAPIALPEDAVFIAKPVAYEKLVQMLCFTLIEGYGGSGGQKTGNVVNIPRWEHFDDIMGGRV